MSGDGNQLPMTEPDWLSSSDPHPMLEFLRGRSARKLRLFAVACCRRVEHMLVPEARAALKVAQRFADGLASSAERKAARARALAAGWVRPPDYPDELFRHARGSAKSCVCYALAGSRHEAAFGASDRSRFAASTFEANRLRVAGLFPLNVGWREQHERLDRVQYAAQATLLRDIFGNPFRPATLDPAWLTSDAVALAAAIYDGSAFHRTPELANALEHAGCGDALVLAHLRHPGEHVLGCWAVDLVLGRS